MCRCNRHPASKRQEGMAMLMVLGIVAATTLLATHMMTVAETLSKELAVATVMHQLKYQCESATDTALWMHLTDRRLVKNRSLGNNLDTRQAFTDFEPWMMDGTAHSISDTCNVYINDAIKPHSVDTIKDLKKDVDSEDAFELEQTNTFIDMYQDYVDSNDLVNIYGKEREDYARDGFPTLPRNNKMQFKAEILWLDNWYDNLHDDITVIPPKGMSIGQGKGASKPNFFTASDEEIRRTLQQRAKNMSDMDIERIIDARAQWRENGTPIEEQLEGTLYITMKNYFSFQESNHAEITAVATAYGGSISVRRTVTQPVNLGKEACADKAQETLSIWEVRNY